MSTFGKFVIASFGSLNVAMVTEESAEACEWEVLVSEWRPESAKIKVWDERKVILAGNALESGFRYISMLCAENKLPENVQRALVNIGNYLLQEAKTPGNEDMNKVFVQLEPLSHSEWVALRR